MQEARQYDPTGRATVLPPPHPQGQGHTLCQLPKAAHPATHRRVYAGTRRLCPQYEVLYTPQTPESTIMPTSMKTNTLYS